jgi:putative ABC transport system permease protein
LENELVQLRAMASLPPLVFLSVTAFLLHVVLARLIASQREIIATLRAFGYSRWEIGWHYLGFAGLISLAGTAAGLVLGVWLAHGLTALYAQFFRFAQFDYVLAPSIVVLATGVSAAAALLGVWSAVWRGTSEPPAQAMQPEPPANYRTSIVERVGAGRLLSPVARMVLRQLDRQRVRTAFSTLGVALAVAILVLGNFGQDTVDFVMDFQFNRVQRQDMTVTFNEPTVGRVLHDLAHLPGVMAAEPFRAVPVRIRFGSAMRRIGVLGLHAERRLFVPHDAAGRPVELPQEGVVLSERLAEILGCQLGDFVQLEVLEQARPVRQVVVVGIIADFLDLNAYMRLDALHGLMREQDTVSGAFLSVDEAHALTLHRALKETPRVAGVAIKRAALESYERTMAENMLRMKTINVLFAAALAMGVVYNFARITQAERSRDLATLRVLGYTRGETARILLGELAVVVILAQPLGLLVGYLLSAWLTRSLDTEVHRFPLTISLGTYAFAALVVIIAAVVSGHFVRLRLSSIDMVAVLKARD